MRRTERKSGTGATGGVTTFLFTDLVGSTQLIEALGDDASDPLIRSHLAKLRAVVGRHNGRVVKSLGDGLMASFTSAAGAMDAAVEMQQVVDAMRAEAGDRLNLRVGINAGEAVFDGIDFYGKPVWVAQRYCDAAEGGQILVSEVVRDLVGTRGGHTFVSRGEVTLRGVTNPVHAFEVAWEPDRDVDLDALDERVSAGRGRWSWAVAALAVTVVAAGIAFAMAQTEDAAPPDVPSTDPTPTPSDEVEPLRTRAVSVRQDRSAGESQAGRPSVANDGELVVFASSSRLLRDDTNGLPDVYLYSLRQREPILISVGAAGPADAGSFDPQISADGSRIVFVSRATNLVPSVDDGLAHIYLYSRADRTLEVISRRVNGALAVSDSNSPSISATGDFVAFATAARNLAVAGDRNGVMDVFRHDVRNALTNRDSVPASGEEPNGPSDHPSISPDGYYVGFSSRASNLVAGDRHGRDVFVYRHTQREPVEISQALRGDADGPSGAPSLSRRAEVVAFESAATNLVAGDRNDARDVFAWSGEGVELVSEGIDGEADGASYSPSISTNGRYVAFLSDATNLVDDDANGATDAFVRDLRSGTITRVSLTTDGKEIDAATTAVALSGDGRYCAFVAPVGAVDNQYDQDVPTVFVTGPLF